MRVEPPEGTPKHITPEQYAELSDRDKYYYVPQWQWFKQRKVRKYAECDLGYRHFLGWDEETVGMGKPYRYEWRHPPVPYGFIRNWVDTLDHSNLIMARLLKDKGPKHG